VSEIPTFLQGGGQMGELTRSADWSQTSLGQPHTWPDSLKSAISISLNSGFPIAIYWGHDFTLIYNDAWSTIPGNKHPWALGKPGAVVWPEIWDGLDAQFKSVLANGESIRQDNALLLMNRYGYVEECYFDYTLSPVMAADGTIGGVFNAVIETSYKFINERRNVLLQKFQHQLNRAHTLREAVTKVETIIEQSPEDIPFYALFLTGKDNAKAADLTANLGIPPEVAAATEWPYQIALSQGTPVRINNLANYLPELPISIWGQPCTEALIVPISHDEARIGGYMVMGMSPRKKLDDDYQQFLVSAALHVGTIANNGYNYELDDALQREQALNEELASANEELNATNEELHQSQQNLATLNTELENRVFKRTQALTESESRFRTMVEQTPVAILVTRGPDMIIEVANPPMLQVIDKDLGIIGKTLLQALPELEGQNILRRLNIVFTEGREWTGIEEPVMINRGGVQAQAYFNISYKPLTENGIVTGIIQSAVEVTDQVYNRLRIQESEANLRSIVMTAHYALMVLRGRDWVIEIANQSLVDLWDKTIEAVTGNKLMDILPEIKDQPFPGFLKQVYDSGVAYGQAEQVFYYNSPTGPATKYVSFHYDPIFDNEGKVTGIIVAAEDITDKVINRQMLEQSYIEQQSLNEEMTATNEELASANEELITTNEELANTKNNLQEIIAQLAASENRMRYMLADAPIAIALFTGKDLFIEAANRKVLEAWGKGNEVIGLPLKVALPELNGQAFLSILDNVFATGVPYHGNEVKAFLEKNGVLEEVYSNFVYHPLKAEDGTTESIVLIANIVTEQVVARKKVEQAEEMLRFSIEAASVGTWYLDVDTREFVPSVRLKEMFGFNSNDEVSYDAAINQIPEDYQQMVKDSVAKAVNSGEAYHVEHPVIGFHDQKLRWLKVSGKLNPGIQGGASYFSGILMDITEQKQDEQRKNDFIGMVSHELKTPLTSLSAYIQMLHAKAQKSEDSFTAGALEKVNTQVKKMSTMINGFLNVSRLESGKIHLNKQQFRLDELVKEIVDETILTTSSHNITLLPGTEVSVNADQDKIGSVVSNLLSNAIKYSPRGMRITVNCEVAGNMAQVSVKDEGMGIKPHDVEKLFERYYRVDSKHTQTISGFGIGLYLCAEIIQRHDGKIWVESELGTGSTFYFSLPLA
jgi:two-component system sensor histidine kinase VicK